MAAGHGGARVGAGRPKGDKPATGTASGVTEYADPLAYLLAVATGREPADGLRIAAAKAALPFTAPKAHAPVESPPPKVLRRKTDTGAAAVAREAWEAKSAAVRAKFSKGKP